VVVLVIVFAFQFYILKKELGLSYDRIEKLIAGISDKMARQGKGGDKPQPVDFSYYLKEWAEKNGFTLEQVKTALNEWAAKAAVSDNYRTKALSHFYRKNCSQAALNFEKAALQGEARRNAIKEMERQADLDTYENWKDAGNALYADYKFREALEKYRNAGKIVRYENYPWQWIEIRIYIGNTEWELGMRVKGEESKNLLSSAVDTYRGVLAVCTREHLPQQWAATQNNLGNALSNQGIRTGGQAGARLLAQAVTAFLSALEVRTLKYLPEYWAQTQNNLATLYEYREKWPDAIQCYQNVYKVYPAYAADKLASLYHDRVFRFEKALEMNRYLVKQDPNNRNALLNLVENLFTIRNFREGNQLIAKLKTAAKDSPTRLILLTLFETANFIVLNQKDTAAAQLKILVDLVSKQAPGYKPGWIFTGTKHFIRTDKTLEPHRQILLTLFTAFEQTDRETILKKLSPLVCKR